MIGKCTGLLQTRFSFFHALFIGAMCFSGAVQAQSSSKQVETSPLASISVHRQLSAPATVISLNDAPISAELNARITEMPVRVGDRVNAKTLLARLDCRDYLLIVERVESQMKALLARKIFNNQQLNRARKLSEKNTLSVELLNEREYQLAATAAEYQSQKVVLAEARHAARKCTIRSPYPAIVMGRLAAVGQFASPGTPLIRLLDIRDLEVSSQVYIADSTSLKEAQEINFNYQNKIYPLSLRTIVPVIDPQTRNREVRLLFSDKSAPSGAAGTLQWRSNILHIPAEFLVIRKNQTGIFLAVEERAKFHILPNAEVGRPAATTLPTTTQIITVGFFGLKDNDLITVD